MENILIDSLYNYENLELGVKVKNPTRYEILSMYNDLANKFDKSQLSDEVIKYLFDNLVVTTKDSKINFKEMASHELSLLVGNQRVTDDFSDIIYAITNIYTRIMKVGMREKVHQLEAEEINLIGLHLKLVSTEYLETVQDIERSKIVINKEREKVKKIKK